MSYTKLTDFAVKDSLPSGTGAKIVRGTELDAEFNAIQADSALKAPLASPTFTGTVTVPTPINATDAATKGVVDALLASPAFTGTPTAPTAAPGTSTTQLATTEFVQTQAFSAALPSQMDNAGKFVTTDGTTASWGDVPVPGLVLLATLTPTVAANVDFLTTFSSTYDNYLVVIQGIAPAVSDVLRLRFANAGVVDTTSNYLSLIAAGAPSSAAFIAPSSGNVFASGSGYTGSIHIKNVNDTVRVKEVFIDGIGQDAAGPTYAVQLGIAGYKAAAALSGLRLYWNSGNNFAAVGRVLVYGYSNT